MFFVCFKDMVMYANEVETKKKGKITCDAKLTTTYMLVKIGSQFDLSAFIFFHITSVVHV